MKAENHWSKKLQEIKERLNQVPGMEQEIQLQWGAAAKEGEIDLVEKRLGISLPPSFRQVIEMYGSSLYFSYFLSDFILPDEFNEVFSGGLSWDIDNLEFINVVCGESAEDEDDEEIKSYMQRLSNMLRFADLGNGDIYAFDMSAASEEKPVFYWDHETGELTCLASSFGLYLEYISHLNFIGDEMWQFEPFLDADGLNPFKPCAKRWKAWFKSLLKNRLETKRKNLKSLFAYTLSRKKWTVELKEAYQDFAKDDIFQMIQKIIISTKNEEVREMLATMSAELIGTQAEEWIENLWKNMEIPSELLARISSTCMEEQKAFKLLTDYLAHCFGDKIDGYTACEHLKYFSAKLMIPWMEQQNIISIDGWDTLFMSITPDWSDLLRWSEDSKRKKVVIDGLYLFVQEIEGLTAPSGLPDKESVIAVLQQLEETELLNIRKKKIRLIIENVDLFYRKRNRYE